MPLVTNVGTAERYRDSAAGLEHMANIGPMFEPLSKICSITASCPTITFCSSCCITIRCWRNSCSTSPRLRVFVVKRVILYTYLRTMSSD
jgi:hypothetical protein